MEGRIAFISSALHVRTSEHGCHDPDILLDKGCRVATQFNTTTLLAKHLSISGSNSLSTIFSGRAAGGFGLAADLVPITMPTLVRS